MRERPMDDVKTSYTVLELDEGASLADVERAHRELSRVWHPDRFAADSPALQERARDKQQQINAARESLVAHIDSGAATDATPMERAVTTTTPATPAQAPPPQAAPSQTAAAPAAGPSPLQRFGEVITEYVAPALRDVIVPAIVSRVTNRADSPSQGGGAGQGSRPQRQRPRDGSGGGRGRRAQGDQRGGGRGASRGAGGGRGRVNGSGRGGKRGQ